MNEIITVEELKNDVESIEGLNLRKPHIEFPQYEHLLEQAHKVAEVINSIEVDKESIKSAKNKLAEARKVTQALNDKRIEVHKYIEDPYKEFKSQVDEICMIIEKANDDLNVKVRELEENEREEKKAELLKLWNARANSFTSGTYIDFEDWLTPQMLNKTTTISKAESNMVSFLEQTSKDIEVLLGMKDSAEYLEKYQSNLNLADTIETINARREVKRNLNKLVEDVSEETFTLTIIGHKDIMLIKQFITENNIQFKEI